MLALGADAVMLGRPFSIAAMGGLTEGVASYAQTLRTELMQAMVMDRHQSRHPAARKTSSGTARGVRRKKRAGWPALYLCT
jgi:hypothetical protein